MLVADAPAGVPRNGIVAEASPAELRDAVARFGDTLKEDRPHGLLASGIEDGTFLQVGIAHSDNGGSPASGRARLNRWHVDYIYNFDPSKAEAVPNGYRHLLAAGLQFSEGKMDLMGDVSLANGEDSSVLGLSVNGAYWLLEDAVRLVGRWDFAVSDDPGGVYSGWGVPASGAEAVQPFGHGDGVFVRGVDGEAACDVLEAGVLVLLLSHVSSQRSRLRPW